jgi:23S rRNA (adenine2503-C2)-methyltransferase
LSANAIIRSEPVLPAPTSGKVNLLGLSREELEDFFDGLGQRPYRARQIMQWLYQRRVLDFDAMTDLSKDLRRTLVETAQVELPGVVSVEHSADGTRKWLLDVGRGQAVETVFIPEPNRGTLCISSQAGCVLDCAFCATGSQGFNRNLTSAEILGQVVLASMELAPIQISNVVFMGMGEPLANYKHVLPVVKLLIEDLAFGLSRRRVTISTAGLVPQMRRLAEDCNVALAVSLHAPFDALRDELVPINRRHPIAELLDACWRYAEVIASRQITFEYVMLDGVNDSPAAARELARLLEGRPAKVNLIPFNAFPGSEYRCSSPAAIDAFWQVLKKAGLVATIRRPRGDDIAAACGQLAGRVQDRRAVRLSERLHGANRV